MHTGVSWSQWHYMYSATCSTYKVEVSCVRYHKWILLTQCHTHLPHLWPDWSLGASSDPDSNHLVGRKDRVRSLQPSWHSSDKEDTREENSRDDPNKSDKHSVSSGRLIVESTYGTTTINYSQGFIEPQKESHFAHWLHHGGIPEAVNIIAL